MQLRRTLTPSIVSLSSELSDELAERCPNLTQEQRAMFAVQIALAELRACAGLAASPDLYETGRRN